MEYEISDESTGFISEELFDTESEWAEPGLTHLDWNELMVEMD